jgi:uncharacterized protein involved in exopolysaccharide biosynthesis
MIILLCLSSTATALFLAFALPEKYEATAMMLVRPEQNIKFPTTAREKELLDFPITGEGVSSLEATSQTYSEVIKSRTIIEKVVRTLRLDEEDPDEEDQKLLRPLVDLVSELGQAILSILKYGRVIRASPFEEAGGGRGELDGSPNCGHLRF